MDFFAKRGGGLTQSKISVSRKMRFLGIFCQKEGILSEKTQNFLELGGGVSANPKFLLTEKIWPSKLIGGGGGVSLVWIFSEKNQFFLNDASPKCSNTKSFTEVTALHRNFPLLYFQFVRCHYVCSSFSSKYNIFETVQQ